MHNPLLLEPPKKPARAPSRPVRVRPSAEGQRVLGTGYYHGYVGVLFQLEASREGQPGGWVRWQSRHGQTLFPEDLLYIGAYFLLTDLERVDA